MALVVFIALPVGAASPPKPTGPYGVNGGSSPPKSASNAKTAPKRSASAPASAAAGKTYASAQIINDPNNAANEYFGTPVTMSKDNLVAVISATQGSNAPGTVWVYTRAGLTAPWGNPQQLVAPGDVANSDQFGNATAINNDPNNRTIIVGTRGGSTYNDTPGAAYAFVLSGGVWSLQHEFGPTGGGNDAFGFSVALSSDGNTALIGAPDTNVTVGVTTTIHQGVAYVFTRTFPGGVPTWSQTQRFPASSGAANDAFGRSVALSADGTIALIGASGNGGKAYVYTASGGTYGGEQVLAASDGTPYDSFGWSVALSGDGKTALIGAFSHNDPVSGNPTGSAYVFTKTGGTWGAPQELNESNNTYYDLYGYRVAISGDGTTVVVGAATYGDTGTGAAWVYVLSGGTFVAQGQQPILPADGTGNDNFGVAVALPQDGSNFLVGASTHTVGADAYQGQVYDFFVSPDLAPAAGALPGGTVGAAYSQQFTATNGAGGPYTYATAPTGGTLSPGQTDGPPPGVTMNNPTAGLFAGTPTTAGSYIFLVTATDSAGGATTQTYMLTIAPGATTTTVTNATAPFSATAQNVTLSATVTDGIPVNEGTVTFTVTQGAATIGAAVISGTVTNGAATASYALPGGTTVGAYTLTAVYNPAASNPNFLTSTSTGGTLTITADGTMTTVANASAPFAAGAQNVTLTATISSTSAVNEGTVTFTVTQGVNTIGTAVVSGTVTNGVATASYALPPSQPGGAYTITAVYNPGADFTGSTNTGTLTIGAGTVAVGPATLPNGTVGTAYSQTITASGGSGTGYHFAVTLGALPAGLTLNSATGAITGTPTAAGPFTFTVTVTDSAANTGSQQYTVTIAAGTVTPTGLVVSGPGSLGNPPTIKVGQQAQLTATATLSDNSTADVTSQAQWSSSNPAVASVDSTGKVTGLSGGTATITATYTLNGVTKTASVVVTVGTPVLTGVQPAPAPASRPSGASAPATTGPTAPPAPAPAPPSR